MKRNEEPITKQKGAKMKKIILLCGILFTLIPGLSPAQPYPTKPIGIIVGSAPGGPMDIPLRVLAFRAEKLLGQPFVVTNQGVGGGSFAVGMLAKQPADGYHLVETVSTTLILMPQLRTLPYKLEDFVPVMQFGAPQSGIVVKGDTPWKTLKDLVEYAKKNPGKVTYSTAGVGTPMHLAMEYIAKQERIEWTHIPYPGSGPALTALLGGHVTAESGATDWIQHVQQGTLRLLATLCEKRMRVFPDVPTLRDAGYNFVNTAVFFVLAPKGTPTPIVKKLDESFHNAMDDPAFIQTMQKLDVDIGYRSSEEMKKFLEEAYIRFGEMIADYKIPKEIEKK